MGVCQSVKIKIVALCLAVLILIGLCACEPKAGDAFFSGSRFVVVQIFESRDYSEYFIRDTLTDVLYLYVLSYNRAAMTPLYNSDGSVMKMSDFGAKMDGEEAE